MFKLLRQKLESLSDTQINILTFILVLVNIGVVLFWIQFWRDFADLGPISYREPASASIPELLKKGDVGELTDEERNERGLSPIPSVIFNTSGIISQVQADRLLVEGADLHFVDQEPRTITVFITDLTKIITYGGKETYEGFDGLNYLMPGMKILIEGSGNIRGKIEFEASYINILES